MEMQFEVPKLLGAFLLGNLCFAFYLSDKIHLAIGILHFVFAFIAMITGFGAMQLYPFAYWTGALFFSLWAVEQEVSVRLFLWRAIAVSGLLASFHAYLQMMGVQWPLHYAPDIDPTTPISLLGQQTKLGAFLAPTAAVSLALGWMPACAFISFVALATKSSFTAFALVVGLATVRCQKARIWPRFVWASLLLGALLIVVGPRFGGSIPALDDHGRGLVYRDLINAWKYRPVLGYGPGSFKALFAGSHREEMPPNFANSMESKETYGVGGGWFEQAHNDYLQGLFEFGITGFASILFAVYCLAKAYRKQFMIRTTDVLAAQGALAAMLANALGNFPWLLSPHFMIGVFAAAITLRAARD